VCPPALDLSVMLLISPCLLSSLSPSSPQVAADETSANVVAWVAKNVVTPQDHLTIVSCLSPHPDPTFTMGPFLHPSAPVLDDSISEWPIYRVGGLSVPP
jgi:hypothetical protein